MLHELTLKRPVLELFAATALPGCNQSALFAVKYTFLDEDPFVMVVPAKGVAGMFLFNPGFFKFNDIRHESESVKLA